MGSVNQPYPRYSTNQRHLFTLFSLICGVINFRWPSLVVDYGSGESENGLFWKDLCFYIFFLTWSDHRCFEAEQKREEREKHPINQREKHTLYPVCFWVHGNIFSIFVPLLKYLLSEKIINILRNQGMMFLKHLSICHLYNFLLWN